MASIICLNYVPNSNKILPLLGVPQHTNFHYVCNRSGEALKSAVLPSNVSNNCRKWCSFLKYAYQWHGRYNSSTNNLIRAPRMPVLTAVPPQPIAIKLTMDTFLSSTNFSMPVEILMEGPLSGVRCTLTSRICVL